MAKRAQAVTDDSKEWKRSTANARGGWCIGRYLKTCDRKQGGCGCQYIGAIDSYQCAECAYAPNFNSGVLPMADPNATPNPLIDELRKAKAADDTDAMFEALLALFATGLSDVKRIADSLEILERYLRRADPTL